MGAPNLLPMLIQAIQTAGTAVAAHPIAAGAVLGGGNSAAHGGDLGDIAKGAALGGVGSFAGGALGQALGKVGAAVGTPATSAATSAASTAASGAAPGLAAAVPTAEEIIVHGAGPASLASSAGSALGGAAGAAAPTSASAPNKPETNTDPSKHLGAQELGKTIVDTGLSALTAPKPLGGGANLGGGVVRPAAGGSGGGAGAAGIANTSAVKPQIYPWSQAATA